MSIDFRHRARGSLARAKSEMETNDDERLKYAALELRMAIEALTYERAQSYKNEIPPTAYRTWQPKRLMDVLLDIEPTADKGGSIAVGREEIYGQPAKVMTSLGSEKVFDFKEIKAHYDALGSFLHTPTLKQLEENGGGDQVRLRRRCVEIVQKLEVVLSSPVFNINFGSFSSIQCADPDCGQTIRKRIPHGRELVEAKCFDCGADYQITATEDGECTWKPLKEEVACPTESCDHTFAMWKHEIKPGSFWSCPKCSGKFQIGLAIFEVAQQP